MPTVSSRTEIGNHSPTRAPSVVEPVAVIPAAACTVSRSANPRVYG